MLRIMLSWMGVLLLIACDSSPTTAPRDPATQPAVKATGTSSQGTTAQGSTVDVAVDQGTAAKKPATAEKTMKTEKAMFGAGCFWGVESTFRKVPGVTATAVGYAGGKTINPTYEQICSDETGHAEVVQIEFDPQKVTYEQLVAVFFENHDPTTLNRQGPDWGTQYRSAVFAYGPEQEKIARAEKERREKSGEYVGPIVTEIAQAPVFYKGEGYHQQYFEKKGVDWTCHTGNGKKRKISFE